MSRKMGSDSNFFSLFYVNTSTSRLLHQMVILTCERISNECVCQKIPCQPAIAFEQRQILFVSLCSNLVQVKPSYIYTIQKYQKCIRFQNMKSFESELNQSSIEKSIINNYNYLLYDKSSAFLGSVCYVTLSCFTANTR